MPEMRIATAHVMHIKHVPVLGLNVPTPTLDEALALADGMSVVPKMENVNVRREGVVLKHMSNNDSFKAISNIWLLNEKE